MNKCASRVLLLIFLGAVCSLCSAQQSQQGQPANCKPITYFGVSGCEVLSDGTCPAGYHRQAVGPSDPRMKAPTRLMCVADNAPSKTAQSPEEAVEAFYKWYVHELRQNRDPFTQDEATLKQYVAAELIAKIKRQMSSPDGLDADYFTKAQDYFDDWETNVSASKALIRRTTATTTVTLGGKADSRHKLRVTLWKEKDGWRISRVAGTSN